MKDNKYITEKNLGKNNEDSDLNYSDDDLMIIDSAKKLGTLNQMQINMNIIAICTEGKFEALLNGKPIKGKYGDIIICSPETQLTNIMISTDFVYVALCITNRALQQALRSYINIWNQVIYVQKKNIVHLTQQELNIYPKFYELIRSILKQKHDNIGMEYWQEIIKGLVSTTLIGLCGFIKQYTKNNPTKVKQNISIFNQFLELLQTSEIKHHPVVYYASKLFISTKYLTVICKKNSGKTANDWIQEYTLNDITYYLRETNLTIKEISNKLGFPNTSFFGKYVKDHFHCTPIGYRQKK